MVAMASRRFRKSGRYVLSVFADRIQLYLPGEAERPGIAPTALSGKAAGAGVRSIVRPRINGVPI